MIEINGRFAAIAVACLSGAFIVGLGIFGGVRNGLTPHEVAAGAVALVIGAIAALWLWRHPSQGGRS